VLVFFSFLFFFFPRRGLVGLFLAATRASFKSGSQVRRFAYELAAAREPQELRKKLSQKLTAARGPCLNLILEEGYVF
jgi:hypothetical protein